MTDPKSDFRAMVDKIPALAWSCRPDGTTEFLNQRWLDYTGLSTLTLRIEKRSDGDNTVLYLSGRIQSEHLAVLKTEMRGDGMAILLDLEAVTLVDREAVSFLSLCEARGVGLLHCSPYIRAWIVREQA
jgi:PAS domain-containing protein